MSNGESDPPLSSSLLRALMTAQWRAWLDVAMRHPSVMIVHGWNETAGGELDRAWLAMNAALTGYPKLVVAHRDTLHIHKYWRSLFENLDLYYDSAGQFDRTITRTDVAQLSFGPGKGSVILSQAITAGRLARTAAEPGLYGLRHDPAAEQFLNMLAKSLAHP